MIQVPNAYKEKNIVYIFTMHCFIKQKQTHHNMMCLLFNCRFIH